MKKTNYLFAGILALSGLLASCNNEEVMGGSPDNAGEEAIATFRIRIGSNTVTRGVEGTDDENILKSLQVLVFDNSASADPTKFSDDATLESVSDVTIPKDGGAAIAKIVTEAGNKIVVAVANNQSGTVPQFKIENGMSWLAFKALKTTAAVLPQNEARVELKLVSPTSGFLMASDPFSLVVTKDGPNSATLSLKRLSAKVQLAVPDNLGTGSDFPADVKVTFKSPLYLPFQYQTNAFLAQPVMSNGTSNVIESAGDGTTKDSEQKTPTRTVTSHLKENMPQDDSDYYTPGTFQSGTTPDWGNAPDNKLYVSENIMALARPTRNYITALLVKLDFTDIQYSADNVHPADGGEKGIHVVYQFKTENDAINLNANAVVAMKGVYSTALQAEQVAANAGPQYAPVPFVKNRGYYRVDLKNKNAGILPAIYSVQRNTYYQVKLTAVNSLGWPNPEDLTDPEDGSSPEENLIEITTDVSVAEWIDISQNEELK